MGCDLCDARFSSRMLNTRFTSLIGSRYRAVVGRVADGYSHLTNTHHPPSQSSPFKMSIQGLGMLIAYYSELQHELLRRADQSSEGGGGGCAGEGGGSGAGVRGGGYQACENHHPRCTGDDRYPTTDASPVPATQQLRTKTRWQ